MAAPLPPAKYVDALVKHVEASDSWLDVGREVGGIIKELQRGERMLSLLRTQAIRALNTEGWTTTELSREFGISRARVQQILDK